MKLFLLQGVQKVGTAGEMVTVRDGYGRNFLIPRKLAVPVTSGTETQIEAQKKQLALALAREEKKAVELKEKIEQIELAIFVQAGKGEKLFGAVTNKAIHDALKEKGIRLDRKKIKLEEPIQKLGSYNIPVKLASKVEASLKIKVAKS